jgi:hypothetical protein
VALVLGVIVAVVLIQVVEMVMYVVYVRPLGVDLNDPEALKTIITSLPSGAFVLLLVGWAVGTFAGAFLAAWVARRARMVHGLVIGCLFLLGAITTMRAIPHPWWVWICALVLFVPAAWLGAVCAPAGRPHQDQAVPFGAVE